MKIIKRAEIINPCKCNSCGSTFIVYAKDILKTHGTYKNRNNDGEGILECKVCGCASVHARYDLRVKGE